MHRLAEDLLLTRCPSVCREWYPKSVVDALDSLDKPWQDGHLFRAISASRQRRRSQRFDAKNRNSQRFEKTISSIYYR